MTAVLLAFSTLCGPQDMAAAAPPPAKPRVVSINLCTDQLVLALADREQIVALSRYARDPRMAFYRDKAAGLAQVGGSAEEVLKLAPSLVVAGSLRRASTRRQLAAFKVRVEAFRPAGNLKDVTADIRRMAGLLDQRARGERLVADLERALARLAPSGPPLSTLQLQRRAFASGPGTLIDDLMRRAGLVNAAARLGVASVRRTTLEAVLKARPDILVMDSTEPGAGDQGVALLAHPGLARLVPAERRIVVPLETIVCGGPQVAAAAEALADGIERVRARLARGGPR